jgi:zinc finger protein
LLLDIPYFKSVIIMCTICESCGVRSSEVKSGTGIEEKGVKYTLKLTDPSDLNRDLLKVKNFIIKS